MSGSDRNKRFALIAFGIALFAIVLTSWISQPASNGKRSESDSAKEKKSPEYVTDPVTSSDNFDPWKDSIPQWAMAVLSFAATGISILAVVYVKDTLIETRKAVAAAQDAIHETRRVGEMQTRAYLIVKNAAAASVIDGNTGLPAVSIKVTLTNGGATPAINISKSVFITEKRRKTDEGKISGSVVYIDMKQQVMEDVAPGEEFTVLDETIPIAMFQSPSEEHGGKLNCLLEFAVGYSTFVSEERMVIKANYWILEQRGRITISRDGEGTIS